MANKTVVIEGKLIKARREEKEFRGMKVNKFFITTAETQISDEDMKTCVDAFKNKGADFTPAWLKEFEGFVNVATKEFPVPAMTLDGRKSDLESLVADGYAFMGATVKLSLLVKDGAIYPKAIKFISEGSEYDPFADME